MSAELDMSQYLDLFLQEADEQIEVLEQETLKLERDPSPARLNAVFRAAHTLKGSSRAMGFANLADLTHVMEDVLDQLRAGRLVVSPEIADSLLNCQDGLRAMVERIRSGEGDNVDCAHQVATLKGFLKGDSGPAKPVAAPEIPEAPDEVLALLEGDAEERQVFAVQVTLVKDCVLKSVRAMMALQRLAELGEVVGTSPNRDQIDSEEFDDTFVAYVRGEFQPEMIRTSLTSLAEIADVALRNVRPEKRQAQTTNGAPEDPAPSGAAAPKRNEAGQTVRVDVARLDNLMNLVGELVIDRTRIAQIGSDLSARFNDPNIDALAETVTHIGRITSDLQDQIMKARMMPIETVFNRFPRVVRDLAKKLDKEVKIVVQGGETELDRSVLEVIGDPLLHIIRNSIDHGIEPPHERTAAGKPASGLLSVSARHLENHIVIEIEDDGRGIDVDRIRAKAVSHGLITADQAAKLNDKEALQFIFASGLSTAAEVSEISGRGVGMDIVRSNIQRLGGLIDLETAQGQGTKFTLRLPLTLAIIRGLLVEVGENIYVLPLGSVVETLRVTEDEIQAVNQSEVIVIRGCTTPLLRLRRLLGIEPDAAAAREGHEFVVIVGLADQRVGLVVDRLVGEQEVVIKSLSRFCGEVSGISGATILGDGNVALIIDVNGVVPQARAETKWH
jgi:two-component system chemotaxis sensor kinase CheA